MLCPAPHLGLSPQEAARVGPLNMRKTLHLFLCLHYRTRVPLLTPNLGGEEDTELVTLRTGAIRPPRWFHKQPMHRRRQHPLTLLLGPHRQQLRVSTQQTRHQGPGGLSKLVGGWWCVKAQGLARDGVDPPNRGKRFQPLLSLHYQ